MKPEATREKDKEEKGNRDVKVATSGVQDSPQKIV